VAALSDPRATVPGMRPDHATADSDDPEGYLTPGEGGRSAAAVASAQADYHGVADPDAEAALAFLTGWRPTGAAWRAFARSL